MRTVRKGLVAMLVLVSMSSGYAGTYVFDGNNSNWYSGPNAFTAVNNGGTLYADTTTAIWGYQVPWNPTRTNCSMIAVFDNRSNCVAVSDGDWGGAAWTAPVGEVITSVTVSGFFFKGVDAAPYTYPNMGCGIVGFDFAGNLSEYYKGQETDSYANGMVSIDKTVSMPAGAGITSFQLRSWWKVKDSTTWVYCPDTANNSYGTFISVTITTAPMPATAVFFSPASGVFNIPQDVVIACPSSAAVIRYTTDGTDPSETNGTVIQSGDAVTLSETTTLKAMAWVNGLAGEIKSATYTFKFPVQAPIISPDGGIFSKSQTVTIICDTPNAVIRYTDDATDPSESNGTVIASGDSIVISKPTTIKAKAWADGYLDSNVTTAVYSFPVTYNRPAQIYQGTATVDGDLSEWTGVEWAPVNQDYADSASDVEEAYYAAKWDATANKIYMAVKVKDTAHFFTDTYSDWDDRDAVELYVHTTGSGDVNYTSTQGPAQQYAVGINVAQTGVWTAMGLNLSVPTWANFSAAGTVDGEWLYYEAAITPFKTFSRTDSNACVEDVLELEDVIGLDVCVAAHDGSAYTGMKSENMLTGKSTNYKAIGIHKLLDTLPTVQVVRNVPTGGSVYPQGWIFAPYSLVNGGAELIEGPDTVPAGTGSVELNLGDNPNGATRLRSNLLNGQKLADITDFSYDTYNVGFADQCYLYLVVDRLGDGSEEGISDSDDDLLFFTELTNGITPSQYLWQRWDVLNGQWYWQEDGGASVLHTWNDIVTDYPNATISGSSGVILCLGYGGTVGAILNVDRVVIGVNGSSILYDFEPVTPGDANYDGKVDVGDLGILAANYGGTGKTWPLGDFNKDGKVDVGDLGILAANYGAGTSGADFNADYARVFGESEEADDESDSTLCGALGLPLIAGLMLVGLMLMKLEE